MNHIILLTHYGSNHELLLQQLFKDNQFLLTIDLENRDSFVSKYEQDKSNGVLIQPLNPSIYSEENWTNFFFNSFELLKDSYGVNFQYKYLIQLYRNVHSNLIIYPNTKIISFIRNPLYSWIYKKHPIDLKFFINTYKKLSKNINELINNENHYLIKYENFISNDSINSSLNNRTILDDLQILLNTTFNNTTLSYFPYNEWVTSKENFNKNRYPLIPYVYEYNFFSNEHTWNHIYKKLNNEISFYNYQSVNIESYETLRS